MTDIELCESMLRYTHKVYWSSFFMSGCAGFALGGMIILFVTTSRWGERQFDRFEKWRKGSTSSDSEPTFVLAKRLKVGLFKETKGTQKEKRE